MAATTLFSGPLPPVARLGFDHGWHILGPTFLCLGAPVLLIDTALVGHSSCLGLEPFGTRDPRQPLPTTSLRIEISGRYLGIWDTRPTHHELITIGTLADRVGLQRLLIASQLVLLVGDTMAAERSWSELWQFTIGVAPIATRRVPVGTLDHVAARRHRAPGLPA